MARRKIRSVAAARSIVLLLFLTARLVSARFLLATFVGSFFSCFLLALLALIALILGLVLAALLRVGAVVLGLVLAILLLVGAVVLGLVLAVIFFVGVVIGVVIVRFVGLEAGGLCRHLFDFLLELLPRRLRHVLAVVSRSVATGLSPSVLAVFAVVLLAVILLA